MSEISRAAFFEVWSKNIKTAKRDALVKYAVMVLGNDIDHSKLKLHMTKLSFEFQNRFDKSRRDKARFLTHNASWLQVTLNAEDYRIDVIASTSSQRGRAQKAFSECCPKTQQRKSQE